MLYPELEKLHAGSTLADLPSHCFRVHPATLGQVVADEFERRPELPGIIVVDDQRELGVISRTLFFQQMSRPFSQEIYRRRPVAVMLQALPEPLLRLGADCPIHEAARLALTRAVGSVYEPVVVRAANGSPAVLDIHVLLLAQSLLLNLANVTIQRQAVEAEAANHAKSAFLASMSHELRTPLNGILGMTELALDTELTQEQREFLGIVKDSADILLALVNEILDFSKIEAGKLTLDPGPFDLRDHLTDTLKPLALRAHGKGLELACHVRPDVPDGLVGDVFRLRQIVINLVNNAVKFTAHGEVVVLVRRVLPDPSQSVAPGPCCELHVTVRDTGIGIDPDKCQAIFEPFVQADGSMTRRFGGTGLGLAICKRLVEMMEGHIWVESTPGVGGQFHFTTRVGVSTGAVPALPMAAESLQQLPVLVVDDNATSREILLELLTGWGMAPQAAPDAATGLAVLEQACAKGASFPLLLLDARMPGTDGFALAAQLQGRPGLAGAVVMMLSSPGPAGDATRCRQLGLAGYLSKPFRPSDVLDTILAGLFGATAAANGKPASLTVESASPAARPLRVLLAEDNPINQTRAFRLLEKQGHTVILANTGKQALAALEREAFDVVLMDVQMPEMDGLEATAAIRAREQGTGRHQPIIALTAHALKGDRERFLAAGMDGYVTKPFRQAELLQAMAAVVPAPAAAASVAPARLDQTAALAAVDGDRDLLIELVKLFEDEGPKQLAALRAAVISSDVPAVSLYADALKGGLGTLGAAAAADAARRVEQLSRAGNIEAIGEAFAVLEREFTQILAALATLVPAVAARD